MKLDENFTRRVRIIGKPGDVRGYAVRIQDAETSEAIEHVFRAIVTLDPTDITTAELSYYDVDSAGNIDCDAYGEPVTKTITLQNPELDVTAFEL